MPLLMFKNQSCCGHPGPWLVYSYQEIPAAPDKTAQCLPYPEGPTRSARITQQPWPLFQGWKPHGLQQLNGLSH